MTREEQIKEYCQRYCDKQGFSSDGVFNIYSLIASVVISDAIRWADEHPKSPWIKFKDKQPEPGHPNYILVRHLDDVFTAYLAFYEGPPPLGCIRIRNDSS